MKKTTNPETNITLTSEQFNAIMNRLDSLEKMLSNQTSASTPKQEQDPVAKKATSTPKKSVQDAQKDANNPKRRTWESRAVSFQRDKAFVKYTWENGDYVFDKGVRMYINAKIKASGGAWNADVRAYAFPNAKAADSFIKANNAFVVEAAKVDEYVQSKKK